MSLQEIGRSWEQVQELASGAGAGRRGLDQGVSCISGGGVA